MVELKSPESQSGKAVVTDLEDYSVLIEQNKAHKLIISGFLNEQEHLCQEL